MVAATDAGAVAPAPPRRERLITLPLAVFLVVVVATVAWNLRQRFAPVSVAEAIALLADGDLDGAERERVLRGMLAGAAHDARERWAVLLAAVALEDRAAYAQARAALAAGGGAIEVPPPAARAALHLGDAILGNVMAASVAEIAGDRAEARARWQLVATQGTLARQAFAVELALAGSKRLAD